MVGYMSNIEVSRQAVKALTQARKLAVRENNVEALLAVANLGFQFVSAQADHGSALTASSRPTVGFGVDHD